MPKYAYIFTSLGYLNPNRFDNPKLYIANTFEPTMQFQKSKFLCEFPSKTGLGNWAVKSCWSKINAQ